MNPHVPWLLLFLLGAVALAQAPSKAVDVAAEPFHKQVLHNQYTRVFRVDLAPGQSTLLHHHDHDYVAVHLSAAQVENAREGGPTALQTVEFGQVGFTPGGFSHRVTNRGGTPFRVLAIEILKRKPAASQQPPKGERGLEIGNSTTVDTILDNDEVRVTETLLAPGAMLEKQQHRWPYLVVALTDLELHDLPQGRRESLRRTQAGDFHWAPAGVTHGLMNMGQQQARFMAVEFK